MAKQAAILHPHGHEKPSAGRDTAPDIPLPRTDSSFIALRNARVDGIPLDLALEEAGGGFDNERAKASMAARTPAGPKKLFIKRAENDLLERRSAASMLVQRSRRAQSKRHGDPLRGQVIGHRWFVDFSIPIQIALSAWLPGELPVAAPSLCPVDARSRQENSWCRMPPVSHGWPNTACSRKAGGPASRRSTQIGFDRPSSSSHFLHDLLAGVPVEQCLSKYQPVLCPSSAPTGIVPRFREPHSDGGPQPTSPAAFVPRNHSPTLRIVRLC